jgi:hypothetical protein
MDDKDSLKDFFQAASCFYKDMIKQTFKKLLNKVIIECKNLSQSGNE